MNNLSRYLAASNGIHRDDGRVRRLIWRRRWQRFMDWTERTAARGWLIVLVLTVVLVAGLWWWMDVMITLTLRRCGVQ